jgi:hypothetical protein
MGFVSSSFVPQTGLISNFYDLNGSRQFNVNVDNWSGLLRAPVRIATFKNLMKPILVVCLRFSQLLRSVAQVLSW